MSLFKNLVKQREGFAQSIDHAEASIHCAVDTIVAAFKRGNKLLICGNGGSAADSQHMAAEFVGRFEKDRPGLPAIALTVDTSALTAIGNDWSYEYVFRRQLEALGKQGDVILGITTSGKSGNVLDALKHAQVMGIKTIGLTGPEDTPLRNMCDVYISVGADRTSLIQERQLAVEHIICELVESQLRLESVDSNGSSRIYYIDVDGTICASTNGYEHARPYAKRIAKVNELYDAGHRIVFYTARGSATGVDHRVLTEKQLNEWGVKFHELRMGKPQYDLLIDDRALSDNDFFGYFKE